MTRIRNTFEELNPSRQWKFESSYLKYIVKISTESSFFLFSSDRHFRYKEFLRCEALRYTKAGSTDPLDHQRRYRRWVDWQRVSTDESP